MLTNQTEEQRRAKALAEMARQLTERGLVAEPQSDRPVNNRLWADDPQTPGVRVELMYQNRFFTEAWFVGKRHSDIQRRRFPARSENRGFNYDGIAKAIREQVEQRIWLQKQIAETKKMLAEQEAKDAENQAKFEAVRELMVKWGVIEPGDQRVKARPEGLHISIEHRAPKNGDEPRLRITVEIAEIEYASDAAKMIAGLKIGGLWL